MIRDASPPDDFSNPFAPPATATEFGASSMPTPCLPSPDSSWSVRHDLTDRDLKRFYGCDFFYEPRPMLGFIPQWFILAAVYAPLGAFLGWEETHSALWAASGAMAGVASIAGSYTLAATASRRSARKAGFTVGRRITIARDGVRVDYPDPPGLDREACLDLGRRRTGATRSSRILRAALVAEAIYPWEAFREVEFRRDYLLLWLQGRHRLVIPVRAFDSIEAAEAFARAAAGWVCEWSDVGR